MMYKELITLSDEDQKKCFSDCDFFAQSTEELFRQLWLLGRNHSNNTPLNYNYPIYDPNWTSQDKPCIWKQHDEYINNLDEIMKKVRKHLRNAYYAGRSGK